jgi:phage terminase Nu1 subunit (DNA packaging protein)
VDIGGAEAVRTWTERAGLAFPTLLDADNRLGALFGFKAIPNGILLDADGVIRYTKFGGFDVADAADLAAIEEVIATARSRQPAHGDKDAQELTSAAQQVATLLREGAAQLAAGERAAGLDTWRAALRLDPDNLIIRKQLWRADHPERFGEVIDSDWQREQLAREQAARPGGSH